MLELAILVSLAYALLLLGLSRRPRPIPLPAPDDLRFVFVIPCLNEELVIGPTLDALLAKFASNAMILVVDDGSDDGTAAIVRARMNERVWLLERRLPEARRGKGEALNAAYRYVRKTEALRGVPTENVVVAIFDADGRIAPNALVEVAAYFRDPRTAAVQLGVEMRDQSKNLLTRVQDFEFVVFGEVFQRARERLGSVGLGGNGQFVRLSALESVGPAPWSDCLTEDLDLGLRLLLRGWNNRYCPTAHVSQQAVPTARRWLRQRTRWFHGHLQCWKHIPRVWRSALPAKARLDVVWYLVAPSAVLAVPLMPAMFVVGVAALLITSPGTAADALTRNAALLGVAYLLTFGSAYAFAVVYWMRRRSTLLGAVALGQAFQLYSNLWFVAGWLAVWRIAAGRRGWVKTERTNEAGRAVDPGRQPI